MVARRVGERDCTVGILARQLTVGVAAVRACVSVRVVGTGVGEGDGFVRVLAHQIGVGRRIGVGGNSDASMDRLRAGGARGHRRPAATTAAPAAAVEAAADAAKRAARARRAAGRWGAGEARNALSRRPPQNGQAVSLTRMWPEQPVHGRRCGLDMGGSVGKRRSKLGKRRRSSMIVRSVGERDGTVGVFAHKLTVGVGVAQARVRVRPRILGGRGRDAVGGL